MNRLGILCDLSRVGAKTSEDVILASRQTVACTHCLSAGLKARHAAPRGLGRLRVSAARLSHPFRLELQPARLPLHTEAAYARR